MIQPPDGFHLGARVQWKEGRDVFNVASFTTGETGMIIGMWLLKNGATEADWHIVVDVKLDTPHEDLKEWYNVVYLYPPDFPAEISYDDMEVIPE